MSTDFLDKMKSALAAGKRFVVATIVDTSGPCPQKPGAKMMVFEDGAIQGTVGGGAIEHRIIRDALAGLNSGRPLFKTYNLEKDAGMICGGEMSAFLEPVGVNQRVIIFGCGHVCRALAPVLANLDFSVTVVDDRSEWADPNAFPPGVSVVCADNEQYLKELGDKAEEAFVLSLTRGHKYDYHILKHFIGLKRRYLGIMASKTKAEELKARLRKEGIDEQLFADVHMPVGVPIGSSSPEEIAISIAAEFIDVRKKIKEHG